MNNIIVNHKIEDGTEMGLNQLEDLIQTFREAGAETIAFSIGYNQTTGMYYTDLDGIDKLTDNDEE